jgi:hypothetical protein
MLAPPSETPSLVSRSFSLAIVVFSIRYSFCWCVTNSLEYSCENGI